ncbi:hypothetical protein AZ270_gp01 [Acidianus tailed spindle virus]|uniref:hypothetical protein n=1 Tax=Acidianus tailed spindle virus TaxID=1797140 RepID=UPI00076F2A79|nr:hypothetical protein AZ270_gp01 [Acidianus tailed spindle virus]AME30024.1 hypothetical protein ATSV_D85a [Acidianus tailed spindle virus]
MGHAEPTRGALGGSHRGVASPPARSPSAQGFSPAGWGIPLPPRAKPAVSSSRPPRVGEVFALSPLPWGTRDTGSLCPTLLRLSEG